LAPRWGLSVAGVVEGVARAVVTTSESTFGRLATPITQANRSAGRGKQRVGERRTRSTVRRPTRACVQCGSTISARGRRYCDACRPSIEVFQASGTAALAHSRSVSLDPAHGGQVAKIRGDKWRERRHLEAEWDRNHAKADRQIFSRGILPLLQRIPTRHLVEVTGLTRAYCSRVQKGVCVPHPRHWSALATLAGVGALQDAP